MKAGLEIHQQLSVGKLFCPCPTDLSEEVVGSFARRLRAASGENRTVDAAAALQASRELLYRYEIVPSSCLVDMDEEPPHPLNPEALDTALQLALLLDARPVDEVVVMRKIVVDGSTTTGFQRTALVATNGHLEVGGRRYGIESICLEEDAGRKIAERPGEVTYRLDRLGIPLIEIATAPDLTGGLEAREVAEEIGSLLRATGRVRRGIGTIREDLNVSTDGGRRIEIKGVQELRKIQEYVEREVRRQEYLLRLRESLRARGASVPAPAWRDLSDLVRDIREGPLAAVGRGGAVVGAITLPGFAGLLRAPAGEEERLGRELAGQARAAGLGGLLHSDELPGHGVDEAHLRAIGSALGLGEGEAFVLVVAPDRGRAERALGRVAERARAALEGVPAETRDPLPDGSTRYSRPLPGRDRMYPETDVPPIPITPERVRRLRAALPERPGARRERLAREHGLSPEMIGQVARAGDLDEFEALVQRGHPPALVARLLTQDVPAAQAAGPEGSPFSLDRLDAVLAASVAGRFSKEGIPTVLQAFAAGATTVDEAIARAGLAASAESLETIVARVLRENRPLVQARGTEAFSPLMGDVMKAARGRYDGRAIAEALRRALAGSAASEAPGGA